MNDAQFATLKENAALNAIVSLGAVLLILWLRVAFVAKSSQQWR